MKYRVVELKTREQYKEKLSAIEFDKILLGFLESDSEIIYYNVSNRNIEIKKEN